MCDQKYKETKLIESFGQLGTKHEALFNIGSCWLCLFPFMPRALDLQHLGSSC